MTTCNFTYSHYKECMERLPKTHGVAGSAQLVHDIDMRPEAALPLAEIEADCQQSAIYCFRLHAPLYNALSVPTLEICNKLIRLGHRIGLHFEPYMYDITERETSAAALTEAGLLETLLGAPVRDVSFHEPVRAPHHCRDWPGLRVHAYSYSPGMFITDSRCRWQDGCLCQHIGKHMQLTAVIHPEWWYAELPAENF